MSDKVRRKKGKKVDGAVGTDKPMFSEPWKGSDLVLMVEDQKLHVHRLILSMSSPVFEAMFSHEFKERDSAEVQLPGKKAEEMRDLLRQVYPNDPGDITMDNVERLLKLADEYQMKGVFERCKKSLLVGPDSPKNLVVKVLLLAQQYDMDEVRKQCYKQLNGMKLDELERLNGFENLDGDSARELLGGRLRKLEKFLKDLYPQFAGIVDCARYLWIESNRPMEACPFHYKHRGDPTRSFQNLLKCHACKEMLTKMTTEYCLSNYEKTKPYPNYSYDENFDRDLIVVLEDMLILLKYVQPSQLRQPLPY